MFRVLLFLVSFLEGRIIVIGHLWCHGEPQRIGAVELMEEDSLPGDSDDNYGTVYIRELSNKFVLKSDGNEIFGGNDYYLKITHNCTLPFRVSFYFC